MRIEAITAAPAAQIEGQPLASVSASAPSMSFGDLMAGALHEASTADREASAKIDALASGASDDLHGTMIAAKEAEISVHLLGTVRNKLLDAFHELWRIGV